MHINMTPDQVNKLIEHEHYEGYICREYGHQLQKLSTQFDNEAAEYKTTSPVTLYLESFQSHYVDQQVVHAFTGLLEGELSEEISSDLNRVLDEMAYMLLNSKKWDDFWLFLVMSFSRC